MLFTRQRLLEWNPSSEADLETRRKTARRGNGEFHQLAASFGSMWVAPAVAGAAAIHLLVSPPAVLGVAAPMLLLWLASPVVAWWISRPLVRRRATLSAEQTFFLRALSRRIWAFFDHVVGADDHWLPPDNLQEYRIATVAHRTSPTNIGLALLANLSACDFGYIPAGQLLRRTTNTLGTMDRLERYRGHFYNWYDTQTLQPLHPLYVSTVDSGNLAGHLLTLRAGLLALADEKIVGVRLFGGLRDTFGILEQAVQQDDVQDHVVAASMAEFYSGLEAAASAPAGTLAALRSTLDPLARVGAGIALRVAGRADARNATRVERAWEDNEATKEATASEAREWAQALDRQCREAVDELEFFIGNAEVETFDSIPTLRELARAGSAPARSRMAEIDRLATQCSAFAGMDYSFLFDASRHLLNIGYNVSEGRADSGYYDLLASEVRLCAFVAIAQRQLPQESWFVLGRLLTGTSADPVLLSWSGSMFEYLMPLLVMPTYDNTLLDQTCKAAVARQIEYGNQRGVPWGMSESGYNTVDAQFQLPVSRLRRAGPGPDARAGR